MTTRAIWLRDTQDPPKGTLGTAFEMEPRHAQEVGAWGFQPDGDEGAFYCEDGDFEMVGHVP